MTRYYFDLHDSDDGVFHDREGQELSDDEQARVQAAHTLTEIARDCLPKDGLLRDLRVLVRTDAHGPLWETRLHWETHHINGRTAKPE